MSGAETYEGQIQSKPTSNLCSDVVTKLEDLNYAIGAQAREAGPEVSQVLHQVKNQIYPCLVAAREIQKRQSEANRGK